jgi:Leucine-rich repeat (LRR) protein
MQVSVLRGQVFGFLSVDEVVTNLYLVCSAWNRTRAAWSSVSCVRALELALRPRSVDLRDTKTLTAEDLLLVSQPSLRSVGLPRLELERFLELAVQLELVSELRVLSCKDDSNARTFVVLQSSTLLKCLHLLATFHQLISLDLPNCCLETPAQLAPLQALTSLERLSLRSADFTIFPARGFPKFRTLRSLDLTWIHTLSTFLLQDICANTTLRSLKLGYSTATATTKDWSSLSLLRELEELDLSGTLLNQQLLDALRSLRELTTLTLDSVKGEWLHRLRGHPTVRRLSLARVSAGRDDLGFLNSLPALEWLSLEYGRHRFKYRGLELRGVVVLSQGATKS